MKFFKTAFTRFCSEYFCAENIYVAKIIFVINRTLFVVEEEDYMRLIKQTSTKSETSRKNKQDKRRESVEGFLISFLVAFLILF